MPFSILGKHTPQWGSVQGLDYLTLELFDINGDVYYVFISASIHSYATASDAGTTFYDDVDSKQLTALTSGHEMAIGERFAFKFTQISNNAIDAVLTIDGECTLKFNMAGQVWSGVRYVMHGTVFLFQCGLTLCFTISVRFCPFRSTQPR